MNYVAFSLPGSRDEKFCFYLISSGVGDSSFYRFNRDRTVTWLKKKVAILSEKLEQERIYVGSGSRTLALADSKQLEVTQGQQFILKMYVMITLIFSTEL